LYHIYLSTQDPSDEGDEAETSILTETKRSDWRMSGILQRKVTVRTFPTTAWVVVASSSSESATGKLEPVEADEEPTETRRRTGKKWSTTENAKLIAAVKKYGKKWVAVASMLPGRTNVRCRAHYKWVMRFDPSSLGPTAHTGKRTTEEDAKAPNLTEVDAVAAPTAATISSTSSIDTAAVSRTDTASVTASLTCTEDSRVASPEQLQQDEGIPVAKRPRFETSLSMFAEDEAADALTILATVSATSSNHNAVTVARRDTASVTAPLTYTEDFRVAPPEQRQQDEGIPVAKRPRFETSLPIAEVEVVDLSTEVEVVDLSTVETATTTLRNHKEVDAARSDTAMVATPLLGMNDSRASARERTSKEGSPRIETVKTSGNNGLAVASMVPDQSKNARGAISRPSALDPTMIDLWSKVLDPTTIDRSTPQWTIAEDTRLLALVRMLGMRWVQVAEGMPGLTNVECRKRWFDHFDDSIELEPGPWTEQEDSKLTSAVIKQNGHYCWVDVAEQIPTRSFQQCKQRWLQLKIPTTNYRLGKWTDHEAAMLTKAVKLHGSNWIAIAREIPGRSNKQCQKRWTSWLQLQLNTNYRIGKWTEDEGAMLTKAVKLHGNNWIAIAKEIPGRSNIQCQKRWTSAVVHNRVWATGDWTAAEDAMLTSGVKQHGRSWGMVAGEVPNRSHVQCRQRFEERQLSNVVDDLRKRC
jgi:hypothetical protein